MTKRDDDRVIRRAAKARWAAIQARAEARAYREHLALLEPDEPIYRLVRAMEWQEAAD